MDFRCEICGCKTEQQELKNYELSGESFNACSFCRRQLDAIKKSPADNLNDAQNLLNMNTNGRRTERAQKALVSEFSALGISLTPYPAPSEQAPFMPQSSATAVNMSKPNPPAVNPINNGSLENDVADLRNQLDKLSESFYGFRRRYYISKIIAIALPVVLVILMLIILVASGALKNLANYYNTIMDYANM